MQRGNNLASRRRAGRGVALLRLGILAASVTAAFVVIAATVPTSPRELQDAAAGLEPVTALAFVAVGAALTLALFPYPALAAASGLLFGTLLGTVVAIVSGTVGAVAALLVARRWGATSVDVLAGKRLRRLLETVGRRGFVAVLYARIVPGVPRGVANYAFGLTPVATASFTVATALGTAPRAFAYAALGSAASLGRLDSPEAIAAFVALAAMALLGAALVLRERKRPS